MYFFIQQVPLAIKGIGKLVTCQTLWHRVIIIVSAEVGSGAA